MKHYDSKARVILEIGKIDRSFGQQKTRSTFRQNRQSRFQNF